MNDKDEMDLDDTSTDATATHTMPGHRVPKGEGVSAPYSTESGGPPQMSVFDGAGNESVVTLGVNEDGRVAEGTGDTLDEAMKDAESGDSLLGDAFNPDH